MFRDMLICFKKRLFVALWFVVILHQAHQAYRDVMSCHASRHNIIIEPDDDTLNCYYKFHGGSFALFVFFFSAGVDVVVVVVVLYAPLEYPFVPVNKNVDELRAAR